MARGGIAPSGRCQPATRCPGSPRQTTYGCRVRGCPPAPKVKAPAPSGSASLSAEIEDLEEAGELAELEAFDKEVDEDFEAEFGGEDEDDDPGRGRRGMSMTWVPVRQGLPLADPLGRPLTTETPEPPRGPRRDMAFLQAQKRNEPAVVRGTGNAGVWGRSSSPGRAR